MNEGKQDEIVQYFIVNSELDMSAGKIAAQVAHIATNIAVDISNPYNKMIDEEVYKNWNCWMKNDHPKIVLRGKEKQLHKLIDKGGYFIRDNGRTEISENSLTCVGFPPNHKSEMHRLVGRLQLYR